MTVFIYYMKPFSVTLITALDQIRWKIGDVYIQHIYTFWNGPFVEQYPYYFVIKVMCTTIGII